MRRPRVGSSTVFGMISLLVVMCAVPARADEAPIAGTLKAVDVAAQTLTVNTTAKGRARQVVIEITPETRIVRFARVDEPGKTGFAERPVALGELKPGWTVSVVTRHAGSREVAEVVKVVHEP